MLYRYVDDTLATTGTFHLIFDFTHSDVKGNRCDAINQSENFFRPKLGAIRVLRFNLYLGELTPNGRDHSTVGGG